MLANTVAQMFLKKRTHNSNLESSDQEKKKKDKGEKTQPNLQSQRRQKRVLTDRRLKPNRDITVTEVGMFPQPEGSDASPGMKAAIGSS